MNSPEEININTTTHFKQKHDKTFYKMNQFEQKCNKTYPKPISLKNNMPKACKNNVKSF